MQRPPAICARCGHDASIEAAACGACGRDSLPWRLITVREAVDWIGGLITVIGVVALIGIGRALRLGSWAELLGSFAVAGLVTLLLRILWLAQLDWEAEGGATATTAFGRLVRASGFDTSVVLHDATGQESVRGDILFGGDGSNRAALPSALGANRMEIAMAAAFVGALARGQIRLTEIRRHHWQRFGPWRGPIRSKQRFGSHVEIVLLARPSPSEDAVADFLLAPFCPPLETDYRGTPSPPPRDGALASADQRTLSVLTIIRATFPADKKPGRTLRAALPRMRPELGWAEHQALRERLVILSKGPPSEVWITLRDALRQAFAQRGRPDP